MRLQRYKMILAGVVMCPTITNLGNSILWAAFLSLPRHWTNCSFSVEETEGGIS
jgi:hypothetical protein